jgi:CBS domain containing-hemolysin-like protein
MDFIVQKSRSRIPIYKDSIDNIVGVITVKDVLALLKEYNVNKKIENIELKKPLMVPVSKKIDSLFKDFQKARMHLAVVIDEYGGTAGIVTLEDLMEEIFGEIVDESDVEEVQIIDVNENEIIVHGTTRLDTINAHLGIKLKGDEMEPVSALILDNLHRFPNEGEKIQHPGVVIEVLKMHKNKILRVKVSKIKI